MALTARAAGVEGPHGPLLLPTSLTAGPGEVTLVAGDPGPGMTTLALALGGRVGLDHGEIAYDGDTSSRVRRDRVGLVDVPNVTEPEPGLPVSVVVGEELALAGLPSRRGDVRTFLAEHDAGDLGAARWETLGVHEQLRWLAETTSARPGVSAIVLGAPDRLGGNPHEWMKVAEGLAALDLIVVVLATHNSMRLLRRPVEFEIGVAA